MTSDTTFAEIQDYAERFIRLKTVAVAKHLNLNRADVEDLRQDLLIDVLQRFPKYDPKRSTAKSFVVMVVGNGIRTIIRLRNESKEALMQSLLSLEDQMVDEDDQPVLRMETVDAEEILVNSGIITRPSIENVELQLDIRLFIDSLPDRLRGICLMLGSNSILAIAKEIGVSRNRVRSDIAEIRFLAEKCGLQAYL